MNNHKNGGHKKPRRATASNSFGDLIHKALGQGWERHQDYERFRTTYVKNEYRKVFPSSIIHIKPRVIGAKGSRKRDFFFSINRESICFVRNLWFAFRFYSTLSEVEGFLTTTKAEDRRRMFERRFEELKALSNTYTGWLKAAGGIWRKLKNFKSTKTDLLAVSEGTADSPQTTLTSPTPQGSAAVADMIREVEQRASYQAGNPDDACEWALYFLALGRPDIGENRAREVLAENPDHAVALYTNAVFLLDASERHQRQALIHDVMHPHDLIPVEAEEQ